MPKRRSSAAPPAPEPVPEPEPEPEPPEHFLCAVCYENPMIDPVMMRCCGQCVCRHCHVRHLEVSNLLDQRCPCCGTSFRIADQTDSDIPVVCVPLRAAIEHEYADALGRRLASLPERDKGRRLEKRFAKMVRKRHEAQFQESQRFMAELEARGM